jgi:DNA-nicking Smr family endonuclease
MTQVLDSHGVKHQEVGSLLDDFIWEHMKRKSSGVKVITGNSKEMKKIVFDIVKEYGFEAVDSFDNSACVNINF